MIPAEFDYVRATSVADALSALAAGNARLIAGGHSIIPLLRFRLAEPARLVDIGGLAELTGIEARGNGIRIGAATTYRDILESSLVGALYPLLTEATAMIGDLQVRNCGTIGGALAHADPASDMAAVLLALDATLHLRSGTGERDVPVRQFFKGVFTTAMTHGEILCDIVLPAPPANAGMAYACFEQKASGYPIAGAAAIVTANSGSIGSATLAMTGVGDNAFMADTGRLAGAKGDDGAAIDAALAGLTSGISVAGDIHAPADYRAHLARIAARRAVMSAFGRAGG
jgi:aerobic carbon-monoxide dehydrogenase medium subunit